jgi:hypothetical protein
MRPSRFFTCHPERSEAQSRDPVEFFSGARRSRSTCGGVLRLRFAPLRMTTRRRDPHYIWRFGDRPRVRSRGLLQETRPRPVERSAFQSGQAVDSLFGNFFQNWVDRLMDIFRFAGPARS